MSDLASQTRHDAGSSWLYDPRVRSAAFQTLLVLAVTYLLWSAASNAIENLQRQKIASGFGFFDNVAGFDISQRLIEYSATSTYFRAFLVGLLNTLIVAAIGIVLASFLGFAIGIARLSSNWLVARLATIYIETLRNLPLLLQLLFWYGAVLKPLPGPRQSFSLSIPVLGVPDFLSLSLSLAVAGLAGYAYSRLRDAVDSAALFLLRTFLGLVVAAALLYAVFYTGLVTAAPDASFFLNNRGIYTPLPQWQPGSGLVGIVFVLGILATILLSVFAKRRQEATGDRLPMLWIGLALIVGLPILAFVLQDQPVTFETPVLKGFNFTGGFQLTPEFVALLFGLVTYTAAFIAEIVRAGILAISKGQSEAARAVGLDVSQTLNLVVIPQAMRVIIPPLTSQYLNLIKNSSLAVAIGYPDLVQVFAGTVLNQTGQAIEVISITMGVYLVISLITSSAMNWYNQRVALVER